MLCPGFQSSLEVENVVVSHLLQQPRCLIPKRSGAAPAVEDDRLIEVWEPLMGVSGDLLNRQVESPGDVLLSVMDRRKHIDHENIGGHAEGAKLRILNCFHDS